MTIDTQLLIQIGTLLAFVFAVIGAYYKMQFKIEALGTRLTHREDEHRSIIQKLDTIQASINAIEKAMARHEIE